MHYLVPRLRDHTVVTIFVDSVLISQTPYKRFIGKKHSFVENIGNWTHYNATYFPHIYWVCNCVRVIVLSFILTYLKAKTGSR